MIIFYSEILIMIKSLLIFLLIVHIVPAQNIEFVDPFIGTLNGGNTFPGALVPWGMVSVSPHNSIGSPSGYRSGEEFFYGAGHTHLSGTGCADLGSIIVTVTTGTVTTEPDQYRQHYSEEKAVPGIYSVHLDSSGVTMECSASIHCGIIKIRSDRDQKVNLLLDAGSSLAIMGGGEVSITSLTESEGFNISGGFCGEDNRQKIYFYSVTDKPALTQGTWINGNITSDSRAAAIDSSLGIWRTYRLRKGEKLLLKTGISYVSTSNAKLNLESEIKKKNFDEIRHEAEASWDTVLSKIQIEDPNDSNKTIFYTALYHALIHPGIISDVNGDYPMMGRKGIGNYKNRNRYSVFSLWDTYRTLHPFLTLVYPERESEIVKTMIDMAEENGYFPKWELAGNETYMMVGAPADIVIADTYIKGVRDFDADSALSYMVKPALLDKEEKAPPVRAGYHELLQYGYIPFEQNWNEDWWVWGPVSTTLEYCFSDYSIAKLSESLQKPEYSELFSERSSFYKNLFDDSTQFFRPRSKNGNFITPFDSTGTEGSGDWTGSGGPGYVEGNARDYSFYVPFDVEGMIKLYGGTTEFYNKLNYYFDNNFFSLNNEPEMFYPYLFTFIPGKESRTGDILSYIIKKSFNTGSGGLPGNDDCGAISAWYLFSVLGFYPVCPASDEYRTGVPLFRKCEIHLSDKYYNGKKIIIEKLIDPERKGSFYLNDKKVQGSEISHISLVNSGAWLIFYQP